MVTTKYRALSAFEFLLGAFIVIGHNVFRVLPNEVPILVVLGLLSVRLREGRWSAIGFKRPESWAPILLIALAAAALRICLGDFVIDFLCHFFSYLERLLHRWAPINRGISLLAKHRI